MVGFCVAADLTYILIVFLYSHLLWKCFCSVQKACLFSHQENKLSPFLLSVLWVIPFLKTQRAMPYLPHLIFRVSECFYIVTVLFMENRLVESSGSIKWWILPWLHCLSVPSSWPPASRHPEMMEAECPVELRDITLSLRQGLKNGGCFLRQTVSSILREAFSP